jgi:hypothetical protein
MTTVAVLQMPDSMSEGWESLSYQWEQDLYIPTFWVLGPDMTILAEDVDYPSDPGRYME